MPLLSPGCVTCGGPKFRGKCEGWCASNKEDRNRSRERRRVLQQEQQEGAEHNQPSHQQMARQQEMARQQFELAWRMDFHTRNHQPINVAIHRPYCLTSAGVRILVDWEKLNGKAL